MVFEIEGGAKSYDGIRDIFSGVDLRIERSEDRVAFLGRNGEGKTTMGKIFAGQEQLTGGTLTYGHNVTLGYYAQHQAEALKPELTVLETLESVTRAQLFDGQNTGTSSKSGPRSQRRKFAHCSARFYFRGDDVYKPVRVLSGGEKSRLALAKMLLEPVNTLILDEPTNHLDVQSKEVVKEALLQFDGTVIVISHDRDFLEDLTSRLITFGDGDVKEYPKPIEIYLEELRSTELATIRAKRAAPSAPKPEPKEKKQIPAATSQNEENRKRNEENRKRIEAEERNKKYKQEKPLRDKISRMEKQIEKLEKEKLTIEDGMYDPGYYSRCRSA